MTINVDGLGNRYLGDSLYGNHSLNYPNDNYFLGYDLYENGAAQFNTDLGTMMTDLGMSYTITGTFEHPNDWYIDWSSAADTTAPAAGRFRMGIKTLFSRYKASVTQARDDAGALVMGFEGTTGENFMPQYGNFMQETNADVFFRPQASVCMSPDSISIYIRVQRTDSPSNFYSIFLHSSYLQNVNPSFGYYTTEQISSCFVASKSYTNNWKGYQYVEPNNKSILQIGEANYPIVCADAQSPDINFVSDWYVFEDNESLSNPAIGRVDNMLISNSTAYEEGKPGKIIGGVTPDAGNNKWMPVGYWMGKTIMKRVYSSFTAT